MVMDCERANEVMVLELYGEAGAADTAGAAPLAFARRGSSSAIWAAPFSGLTFPESIADWILALAASSLAKVCLVVTMLVLSKPKQLQTSKQKRWSWLEC